MVPRSAQSRFRIEAIAALLTAALAVLTAFVPDWIEVLTGADPDRGDGTIEVLIVAVLAVLCAASSVLAWLDYRRARPKPVRASLRQPCPLPACTCSIV